MLTDLTEIFQTPRLRVCRWLATDLPVIMEVYGDPETVRYVGDGMPLSAAQGEKWLEVTARNYEKRGYGMFTLLECVTGEIIGFGGLVHPNNVKTPEVKYAIRKKFRGQGFATEFLNNMVIFGNQNLQMNTIVATVYPQNLASKKNLLKCGFQHEIDVTNEDGTQTSYFKWIEGQ
jgi:RimJ/RimL family protein N-acetyltransferase